MDAYQTAYEILKQRLQVNDEPLLEDFAKRVDLRHLQKGATLVREGETIKDCYCLIDGIIRIYYMMDGEEITESLRSEQGTVVYPSIFIGGEDTANATVSLVTDCTLLHMTADDMSEVMRTHPDFAKLQLQLVLQFVERSFKLKRLIGHMNPTERYRWFAENRPELAERVPQKYIASFLGMTPVSLSRIRGKLREQNAPEE